MSSRIKLFIPVLVLGVLAFVYTLDPQAFDVNIARAHKFFSTDSTMNGPIIEVNEEVHDFKNIELNTLAEHTFFIKNTGTDTLHILNTHASCGCTSALMDEKAIAPNGISRLKVTFDAHNKGEGPIVKSITITSDAKNKPEMQLRIQGTIVKSKTAHKAAEMMHIEGVFQGDCAKCHVDKGKGELGARLFDADCGICHGSKADGKPGAELASDNMMRHSEKEWKKIIANGIPNSNMPAFHTKNKGPLNDDEIASLVEYMGAFKKELNRQKSLKSLDNNAKPVKSSSVK